MKLHFLLYFLLICFGINAAEPLVQLPRSPDLTANSRALIYNFEIGGGASYYNRFLTNPEWPGFSSGITWGCGFDAGYNSKWVILHDWHKHKDKERLSTAAGITGQRAKAILYKYKDIFIPWSLAEEVFNEVTIAKFWRLCERTFPGFDKLAPDCQGAILSLVFNRGNSLVGSKRVEMRAIKELIPKKDYKEIANQIRKMKKIWIGTDIYKGMSARREAEALLVEGCISK